MTDLVKTTLGYTFGAAIIAGLSYIAGGRLLDSAVIFLGGMALPAMIIGMARFFPDDNNDNDRED